VFYARTRNEVAQRVNVALKAQQDGLPITRARLSVGTYMATWLESARPGLRPRTFARYEQYVRIHALPAIGRVPLARLGPQDLERLYAARIADGSSAGTVVHLHAVMHRALAQAARWACVRATWRRW
jgi:integrase-like protein